MLSSTNRCPRLTRAFLALGVRKITSPLGHICLFLRLSYSFCPWNVKTSERLCSLPLPGLCQLLGKLMLLLLHGCQSALKGSLLLAQQLLLSAHLGQCVPLARGFLAQLLQGPPRRLLLLGNLEEGQGTARALPREPCAEPASATSQGARGQGAPVLWAQHFKASALGSSDSLGSKSLWHRVFGSAVSGLAGLPGTRQHLPNKHPNSKLRAVTQQYCIFNNCLYKQCTKHQQCSCSSLIGPKFCSVWSITLLTCSIPSHTKSKPPCVASSCVGTGEAAPHAQLLAWS